MKLPFFAGIVRKLLFREKIKLSTGNILDISPETEFKKLDIMIKGKNNIIKIGNLRNKNKLRIYIYGNNNVIEIDDQKTFSANIYIGMSQCPADHCSIVVGSGKGCIRADFRMAENDSHILIGKDCLISNHVLIWCTDMHSIINKDGQLLNQGKKIIIGNHVWIGKDVHICKNTTIADNTVIGWNSVVTGKHDVSNVVLAGAPAREVKHNINWDERLPQEYQKALLAEEKHKKTTKKTC